MVAISSRRGERYTGKETDEQGRAASGLRLTVLVDAWPVLSETFVRNEVAALRRAGHAVLVEAGERGDVTMALGEGVSIGTEDPSWRALADLAWLVARRPRRCLADLRARTHWRAAHEPRPLRELAPAARRAALHRSEHLHAHFAAGAALDALRLGDLLDLPVSITAHGHDIFARPRQLEEKLARASFTTSGCDYTVEALRRIAGAQHADRVHKIVMGVEPATFTRTSPHPHERVVVAIGRLVPKKGFADLVEAVALLRYRGAAPQRTVIVGEGPLRDELEGRIAELGLGDEVELRGACAPEEVRELLELAAVLAMPCVVAPDGDRDSMPVVVKEALAMEVPVVASREVGLPELVRPEWGRLHPPGDVRALADALAELLALEPHEHAAMGRAGRAFVIEHCHVDRETARLAGLIAAARDRS